MSAIQRPQGTFDLLPDDAPKLEPHYSARLHRFMIERAQEYLERAGALYIQTPLFEEAPVIQRGVGGSTDIVRKEMFSVYYQGDHGGYVLRPEATAGLVRAYIQNGLKQFPAPLKLWTHGPMFRAERQQKGRQRQFHQIDFEVFGSDDPLVDAEAIALMYGLIRSLGLKNVELRLGSVGDPDDRVAYNAYLRNLFAPHTARLSEDSKARLELNPMRILDAKDPGDLQLIEELRPKMMLEVLGEASRTHFEAVCAYLQALEVPYVEDPAIVRGLDYYRRTAWEIHHADVGAKSALGGGGRYDGLTEMLGGPPTPGIGWAFGVERLLIAMQSEGALPEARNEALAYVGALDDALRADAARVAVELRRLGRSEFGYRAKGPGAHVKDALRRGARYLIMLGSDEAARGEVAIKDLNTNTQTSVPRDRLLEEIGHRETLRLREDSNA
ncbi:histidyl-tRNA synthetase [Deinobacterium chartae]|uniref:Histidine--tRNA ligase n=1 Tax=Deinobacterium chartae TaxID=521158 RepID=A0A841HWY5_9DEIO|nr:histidine--tRNA ligase [Deinobacterium chartae]MBB6096710.1 histidyl-tRNA synthetase [Deinobacterium chartae]